MCGVPIKKGMTISIPIIVIHHLPEYWPQPETFDPERYASASFLRHKYYMFDKQLKNCLIFTCS